MEPKDFKTPPSSDRQKPVFSKKKDSGHTRLVVPDPDCFEGFEEDPNLRQNGPDIYGLGPILPDSMLSAEKVTPLTQADRLLSEQEDDTPDAHMTSLIASIVRRRKKQKRQMILLLLLCFVLFSLLVLGVVFATLYKPPVDEKLPFDPTREMGTRDADSEGIPDALTDEDSRLSSLPAEL